jgi:serine/threonine protein kinase
MSLKLGPYIILSELGAGGMGVVYKAMDTQIMREVALKRLRSEFAASAAVLSRFRNEATLQGRLNHPGIAQLYSLYEGEDAFCIVMEFVDGVVLKELIPLSWQATCALMLQILEALGYAHRLGVLHRDIKPENVIVNRQGGVKIMDFGIAHAVGSQRMTREKSLIGTIEYMAPERILGKQVDSRSDIYSLGILLFECLTGRLPFESVIEYDLMRWHIEGIVPEVTRFADAPIGMSSIITRAMEKTPSARYASCDQMAEALRSLLPDKNDQSAYLQAAIQNVPAKSKENLPDDLPKLYLSAWTFLSDGDLASAERLLRRASSRFPNADQLSLDATFAARIVAEEASSSPADMSMSKSRQLLFKLLLQERINQKTAAIQSLADSIATHPISTMLNVAHASTLARHNGDKTR